MVEISEFFMYKAHRSPRFHSVGIASLLEFDPVSIAVSACSMCETIYVFSQRSEYFVYISSLDFGVFFIETCFTLWIRTCAKTMFHQHSQFKLFSVCAWQ
jgi:hypothetical protein